MENEDQQPIETLEAQMSESSEVREEKNGTPRLYSPPQVFLVGKAKRLIAGYTNGYFTDYGGWWCYTC